MYQRFRRKQKAIRQHSPETSDIQPEESANYLEFKRLALRDAVICIGWLKLLSVIYYICLYYMVHMYSKSDISTVLQVMIMIVIPFQVLHGTLLFFGALENKLMPLEASIWLCLMIASYNTVLGTVGCIYFIRMGFVAMHFVLAFAFLMLAFSLFTVICHDILMVYAYKQILVRLQQRDSLDSVQSHQQNEM